MYAAPIPVFPKVIQELCSEELTATWSSFLFALLLPEPT